MNTPEILSAIVLRNDETIVEVPAGVKEVTLLLLVNAWGAKLNSYLGRVTVKTDCSSHPMLPLRSTVPLAFTVVDLNPCAYWAGGWRCRAATGPPVETVAAATGMGGHQNSRGAGNTSLIVPSSVIPGHLPDCQIRSLSLGVHGPCDARTG